MGYGWIQNILNYPCVFVAKLYCNYGGKGDLEGGIPQERSRMAKWQMGARFILSNAHTHLTFAALSP